MQYFDVRTFLNPKYQDPKVEENNDQMLQKTSDSMIRIAKKISQEEKIDLNASFKKLLGALDQYDAEEKSARGQHLSHPSSFLLRSALLLASQQSGCSIESWMAYTKGGKPHLDNPAWVPWGFLDNWKNWVPEAQGMMAKFSEIQITKARALANEHNEGVSLPTSKGHVVLLKGGFGAGKSHLAGEKLKTKEEEAENKAPEGLFSPDVAKRMVRQAMPAVPHSMAHVQGSQLAYKLFDEVIQKTVGTVAYDTSLGNPKDIEGYLAKCKQAGKKMEIHDVVRNDMARFLSVLKRSVDGHDPRIPIERMINTSIDDKKNRVDCMRVILNDDSKEGDPLAPVYHFHGSAATGFAKEALVLSSNGRVELKTDKMKQPKIIERLRLEGIELDSSNKPQLIKDKETYAADLKNILMNNVKKVSSRSWIVRFL